MEANISDFVVTDLKEHLTVILYDLDLVFTRLHPTVESRSAKQWPRRQRTEIWRELKF